MIHEDVLFVVAYKRWHRVLLRTVGIASIVVGGFGLLMDLTPPTEPGAAPGRVVVLLVLIVLGVWFLWGAHTWRRKRLDVTAEAVWVYGAVGRPRRVRLGEITRLVPIPANFAYPGGISARGQGRLFSAARNMDGYAELIDHLGSRRPDLPIPDAAL